MRERIENRINTKSRIVKAKKSVKVEIRELHDNNKIRKCVNKERLRIRDSMRRMEGYVI